MPVARPPQSRAAIRSVAAVLCPLLALPLLAACAATSDAAPAAPIAFDTSRQCFFSSTITGYSEAPDGPDGEERLLVHTGARDRWLFEAIGSCPELDWAQAIALDLRSRSSLCTGTVETLLVPVSGARQVDRCQVRLLGKVIREES